MFSQPTINPDNLEKLKKATHDFQRYSYVDYQKGITKLECDTMKLDLKARDSCYSIQDTCNYLKAHPNITIVAMYSWMNNIASLLEIKSLLEIDAYSVSSYPDVNSEEKLSIAIAKNSSLLDLSLPALSPNGISLVANAIKSSRLKSISLSVDTDQENLLDDCYKSIADNLIRNDNSGIETLYFSRTYHYSNRYINESCLNQITEALKTNTNLKNLRLYDLNKLSDECINNFVQVVEDRRIPLKVAFHFNPNISEVGKSVLAKSNYIVSFEINNSHLFSTVIEKAKENKKRIESENTITMSCA